MNRRHSSNSNQPEADFFRVSCWDKLGESCQHYLAKGRKVAVVGPVSVSSYEAKDGSTRFSLEVRADEVEFLSAREQSDAAEPTKAPKEAPVANRYDEDDLDSDLPF